MTIIQTIIGYSSLIVFLALPLLSMFVQAFVHQAQVSLYWFWSIIASSDYFSFQATGGRMWEVRRGILILWGTDHGIFLNSLIIAFNVTLACCILGVVLAMIMGRYNFPGKRLFQVILLVPLLATPFVNAYVIGKLFNPRNGLINWILNDVLHIIPWRLDIDGLFGIAVGSNRPPCLRADPERNIEYEGHQDRSMAGRHGTVRAIYHCL